MIPYIDSIALEIRRAFGDFYNYRPKWAFVATWFEVPEYGRLYQSKINNTFQAIIVTNGILSFAIYNYERIEWPLANSTSGHRAQVVFNAGDGIKFYKIKGSFTDDVTNVNTRSNVGIDGKWIFRVDGINIVEGACSSSGYLTVRPDTISFIGGGRVTLTGPCFNPNDTAPRIVYNYDTKVEVNAACQIVDFLTCMCDIPFLNRVGRLPLKLILNQNSFFLGWINSYDSAVVGDDLQGLDPFYTSDRMNQTVNITWSEKYGDNASIYGLYLATLQTDNWNVSFRPLTTNLSSGFLLIAVKDLYGMNITNEMESSFFNYVVIKLITGTQIVVSFHIPFVALNSTAECDSWFERQPEPDIYFKNLPPCIPNISPNFPLTLNGFTRDETCNPSNPFLCDVFQPNSTGCYISTATGLNGSGQQCCYNSQGRLTIGYPSGGTLDLVSGNSNKSGHFLLDVLPFINCCKLSAKCEKYYQKRPSDNSSRWRAPNLAGKKIFFRLMIALNVIIYNLIFVFFFFKGRSGDTNLVTLGKKILFL